MQIKNVDVTKKYKNLKTQKILIYLLFLNLNFTKYSFPYYLERKHYPNDIM